MGSRTLTRAACELREQGAFLREKASWELTGVDDGESERVVPDGEEVAFNDFDVDSASPVEALLPAEFPAR